MIALSEALRTALLANDDVTRCLGEYIGEPAVIVRDRTPSQVPSKVLYISPNIGDSNRDGLATYQAMILRQISIYGDQKDAPLIERCADAVRLMFHRKPFSLSIPDFKVLSLMASQPVSAPVSDVNKFGRMIGLSIEIHQLTPAF